MPGGGVGYNMMMTGILPEAEESLIPYYRDCYYYDSVAGATVDIISSFPFSDWTLTGLPPEHLDVFNENLARIDLRALLPEISNSYLVDGAFVGSPVFDPVTRCFQDILIHDRLNCSFSEKPFHALDPVITVNSAASLNQFLHSDSPYIRNVMAGYPRGFIDSFLQGQAILDPVTTIFIPRRTLRNRVTTSYLKRILPLYMLEKTLYRGTLIEATKRMRATTHVQVGTDTWEPTVSEMQTVLAQFQAGEMDPLGAWVVTRQGIQVQDVRQGGDFWKWTDVADMLIPYKLRALGISEAFLSGDANFNAAETALSVFMENMAAYRGFITHRLLKDKIFPLIAVANNFYRDPARVAAEPGLPSLLRNIGNHENLYIPDMRWHKSLDNHDPQVMDTLEKMSEKGVPIPLKMWATAANVDLSMLIGDLREDDRIRKEIEAITGKKSDAMDTENSDGDFGGFDEGANALFPGSMPLRPGNNPMFKRRRPLLSRAFPEVQHGRLSKSGNSVHATMTGEHKAQRKYDELIMKASKSLADPERARVVRNRVIEKAGRMPNLIRN
jgi:hypothetical protein